MSVQQVVVAWALLLVQGSRRLYECVAFARESGSEMWVGHWALGVLFYTGMGVGVWVEGV
ncbi:hypothetical protein LTR53_009478, partial [Teratosphaeriaceae sp. CCFEE 6253]